MAALKYWVWLASLPGLFNRSKLLLLEHFSSPEDVYYADEMTLAQVEGLAKEQVSLVADKSLTRANAILSDCAQKDIFIVTMQDAQYPARLRNIYDPPILLYGRGAMPLFDDEVPITLVGTRSCTPYGISCAEKLGYELGHQGAVVVSGMAKGIDAAALRGALRAGGFTVAVLGGGVDVIYPAENRRLYEDILTSGVILSEYPPQTEPAGRHFPARNRIMSGLSVGTVVVEAPEKSGALITANTAVEQGRDVFAVPGPIDAPNSAGCHQLIREGAGLVRCGWDVLEEYAARYPHKLRDPETRAPAMPEKSGAPKLPEEPKETEEEKNDTPALQVIDLVQTELTDDQTRVLRVLSADTPMLTDEVAELTELPVRRVLSALTVLEIDGYACQQGARSFLRTAVLENNEEVEV